MIAVLLGACRGTRLIPPLGWVAMVVIVASVALVTTGEAGSTAESEVDSNLSEPMLLPGSLGEPT